ncbi:hypothetical protein ID866_10171 [Astraeus odoratus]|nr:hypothetical protein ID866_10171 [Astraeus odoratus]
MSSRQLLYFPRNTRVLPPGIQLDLSNLDHGKFWEQCRWLCARNEPLVVLGGREKLIRAGLMDRTVTYGHRSLDI